MKTPVLHYIQEVGNFSPHIRCCSEIYARHIKSFIFRHSWYSHTVNLPTSGKVHGITSWNDELYVVTKGSHDIDVYDIDTLDHRRKIRIKRLVNAWDIVAHANVLYVSELQDKMIHRIQLSDGTFSHWSGNSVQMKLSINKKGNIVVSCFDPSKIIEYTPTGSCVREIQMDAINKTTVGLGLKHAIQLDDDRFLICYTTTTTQYRHEVWIIDSAGYMMARYGGGEGSRLGQMDYPCHLTIDRNGFILVVDAHNNRIIQLNASLEFIREFIPGSVGLKEPVRIHQREDKKRLYIAEYDTEQNIAIFDL